MSTTNCRHFSPESEITVLGPRVHQGLYVLHALPGDHLLLHNGAKVMSLSTANQLKRERLMRLHVRLGHASKAKMRIILTSQPIDGLQAKDLALWEDCAYCAEANTKRIPHPKKADIKTSFYAQRIDWDLTGTQAVRTPGGATCAMLGVCRHTHTWFAYPLRSKTQAPERIDYTLSIVWV